MKVDVVHLRKHFARTSAVDDVSFTFASGQIFGFVGPNGAGKTTTMRILATLDEPTGGDALVDGVSVVEEPEATRRLVGYVPDSLPVHRDMTVHEYLDFFARANGLQGALRRSTVESIEEFTRLVGIRDKTLHALSKGMKQRVTLARALLPDPPVLLLDEPAAGLDPRARIELRELLRILAAQDKAILISSHILSELAEICNGAVIIEQGRLLRAGTMHEILTGHDPVRTVVIRVLGDLEALHRELLQMPHVEASRPGAGQVEVELDGDEEVCAALLATLVGKGWRVVEFRHRRSGLEDVFMTITRGDVQ